MSQRPPNPIPDLPEGMTREQLDDLQAGFSHRQTQIGMCVIVVAIAFLFIVHEAMAATSRALAMSDGHDGLHLLAQPILWWFFPGFGAITLSYEITLLLWSVFSGRRIVGLYTVWASQQPKQTKQGIRYYDSRKNMRVISLFLTLPACIGTSLALNMHTSFSSDAIRSYGYAFASPTLYSYADIRRITLVQGRLGKHNSFIEDPRVVVDFTGGRRWQEPDQSPQSLTELTLRTLSDKTKLPVGHARLRRDIPALPPG